MNIIILCNQIDCTFNKVQYVKGTEPSCICTHPQPYIDNRFLKRTCLSKARFVYDIPKTENTSTDICLDCKEDIEYCKTICPVKKEKSE